MERTVDLAPAFRHLRAVSATDAPEPSDDAGLAGAARAGDAAAFGQLYSRYARMVHGILLARVPPAEVDDLVQEVFLQAWRRITSLREAAAFGGWLAMIARNRATDYFRRSTDTAELPDTLAAADSRHTEARAVLEAIKSLPEAYREPLLLRLVEGMTGPEIAAQTGLTPASVRVNLHRGMKQLRAKLGRMDAHA
ncbi:MAG: RNA polymerase sigma factor [Candidatus Acidiferrales bacterium]